jgi:hypothetical protein
MAQLTDDQLEIAIDLCHLELSRASSRIRRIAAWRVMRTLIQHRSSVAIERMEAVRGLATAVRRA